MTRTDARSSVTRRDVLGTAPGLAGLEAFGIGGVALDVMNHLPYKSDPRPEQWVSDSRGASISRPSARQWTTIGCGGWIQIEGAVPKGQPLIESHSRNVRFMRTHFS